MRPVKASDIRAFVARDRRLVEEAEAAFWAARKSELGVLEALRIGETLRREVQEQRPDWPAEEERLADLETHRRVSAALRSVSSRLPG